MSATTTTPTFTRGAYVTLPNGHQAFVLDIGRTWVRCRDMETRLADDFAPDELRPVNAVPFDFIREVEQRI